MIKYLKSQEIAEVNFHALASESEEKQHVIHDLSQLMFVEKYVKKFKIYDLYEISLAYCISLILTHPFQNGNHRTSLLCAELFLRKNGLKSNATDEKRLALSKWRIEYEAEHDLEREFWHVAITEKDAERWKGINGIMKSEYGNEIKTWLRKNYG